MQTFADEPNDCQQFHCNKQTIYTRCNVGGAAVASSCTAAMDDRTQSDWTDGRITVFDAATHTAQHSTAHTWRAQRTQNKRYVRPQNVSASNVHYTVLLLLVHAYILFWLLARFVAFFFTNHFFSSAAAASFISFLLFLCLSFISSFGWFYFYSKWHGFNLKFMMIWFFFSFLQFTWLCVSSTCVIPGRCCVVFYFSFHFIIIRAR